HRFPGRPAGPGNRPGIAPDLTPIQRFHALPGIGSIQYNMRIDPSKRGSHALLPGSLLAGTVLGAGCKALDHAPRGAATLREVTAPQTSPGQAAEMATDPYSAENRYRGTTLLSSADFGGEGVYIQLYVDGADDPDPSVRAAAIRALGRH